MCACRESGSRCLQILCCPSLSSVVFQGLLGLGLRCAGCKCCLFATLVVRSLCLAVLGWVDAAVGFVCSPGGGAELRRSSPGSHPSPYIQLKIQVGHVIYHWRAIDKCYKKNTKQRIPNLGKTPTRIRLLLNIAASKIPINRK